LKTEPSKKAVQGRIVIAINYDSDKLQWYSSYLTV